MTIQQHIDRIFSHVFSKRPHPMISDIPQFGSPRQLQIILDNIDAAIYVSDITTYELLFMNQYSRKMLGDHIGKRCWESLQAGQEGPCPFCTNDKLIDANGNPTGTLVWEFQNTLNGRWYQCRDSAIRWTGGRLVRMEIATDITVKKLAEDQIEKISRLKEQLISPISLDEKLSILVTGIHQTFDASFTGIWLIRDHNTCSEECRFFGTEHYQNECISHNSCLHLVAHAEDETGKNPDNSRIPLGYHNIGRIVASSDLKIIRNDLSSDSEGRKHTRQGSPYCHAFAGYRLISTDGETIGVFGLFRKRPVLMEEEVLLEDIASTISQVILGGIAEKALQEKTNQYRTLIENIPQRIYMKDQNFVYLSCNNNYAQDLQINPEEITGKTDYDLFPKEFADTYRKDDQRVILSGKTEETVERYLDNGKERWINAVRTPLKDPKGGITGILGVFWDITEKIDADNELQSLYHGLESRVDERTAELLQTQAAFQVANEKLNLLNSITRHDILNQITALCGYLELTMSIISDEEAAEYIERANTAAGVIHRHILFTRLYQDIGVYSPSWQKIKDTIQKAIMDLSSHGITFVDEMEDLEIFADPLLEKVFYTLIENTIRHGNHATQVQFSNHLTPEGMNIIYIDDGTGIHPDDKKKIFERGYGKNTGFGLYLSREILSMTGMTIRETGKYGTGVRFEIFIPENHYQ